VRTALLLGALTTLTLGLLLAAVSRDFAPFLRAPLRLWLRGNLLQPLGFVLFALRGRIDDLLSVVVANVLIVVAFSDYARALHQLLARPDPRRASVLSILIVSAGIAWFTLVHDAIAVRIVLASIVLAALSWLSAAVLMRGRWRRLTLARRVTGVVFAFGGSVLLVRAGHALLHPHAVADGLQSTLMQAITFGTGAVLPLLTSYGFLLLCNDRMRQELERSAAIDYLTGALNRGATEHQGFRSLALARRRGTRCAVIVIDVDHFKTINDAYGHAVGDAALREIVRRLQDGVRVGDTLGRLGGEEFLVLLDDTDPERALATAERLRHAICDTPLPLEPQPHATTISLGVAVLHDGDESFSDLLRRADRALYAAKHAGRNRVECAPD
jgi:diguanylate cyclase (GGDEF)-like protein